MSKLIRSFFAAVCISAVVSASEEVPPSPAGHSKSSSGCAFVFVRRFGSFTSLSGPQNEVFYMDGSGAVQWYREKGDTVESLKEAMLSVDVLVGRITPSVVQLPKSFIRGGGVVTGVDAVPSARTDIIARLADGVYYSWSGADGAMGPAQKDIAESVRRFVGEAVMNATPDGAGAVRAELLDEDTIRECRRENLFTELKDPSINASIALVLASPFKLVAVAPGTNPFMPILRDVAFGRSALQVVYMDKCFQIRSYRSGKMQ